MSSERTGQDRDGVALAGRSEGQKEAETRSHILLVDDDEDTRGVLEALLHAEGFSGAALNCAAAFARWTAIYPSSPRSRPNGEQRRVLSTGTSVRDESGNVARAIVVFRDVTELRRLEQQREEYVALISHDLRAPLSGILMFVSGLKRSMEQTGLPVSLAERAERNVMRMKAMLDHLTEATTLESQGIALQHVVCDLRELVVCVVDGMDDEAARRVRIETDGGPSYGVLGDPARLERVVANLLTNALKYSGRAIAVLTPTPTAGSPRRT